MIDRLEELRRRIEYDLSAASAVPVRYRRYSPDGNLRGPRGAPFFDTRVHPDKGVSIFDIKAVVTRRLVRDKSHDASRARSLVNRDPSRWTDDDLKFMMNEYHQNPKPYTPDSSTTPPPAAAPVPEPRLTRSQLLAKHQLTEEQFRAATDEFKAQPAGSHLQQVLSQSLRTPLDQMTPEVASIIREAADANQIRRRDEARVANRQTLGVSRNHIDKAHEFTQRVANATHLSPSHPLKADAAKVWGILQRDSKTWTQDDANNLRTLPNQIVPTRSELEQKNREQERIADSQHIGKLGITTPDFMAAEQLIRDYPNEPHTQKVRHIINRVPPREWTNVDAQAIKHSAEVLKRLQNPRPAAPKPEECTKIPDAKELVGDRGDSPPYHSFIVKGGSLHNMRHIFSTFEPNECHFNDTLQGYTFPERFRSQMEDYCQRHRGLTIENLPATAESSASHVQAPSTPTQLPEGWKKSGVVVGERQHINESGVVQRVHRQVESGKQVKNHFITSFNHLSEQDKDSLRNEAHATYDREIKKFPAGGETQMGDKVVRNNVIRQRLEDSLWLADSAIGGLPKDVGGGNQYSRYTKRVFITRDKGGDLSGVTFVTLTQESRPGAGDASCYVNYLSSVKGGSTGAGTALLHEVFDWAKANNCKTVTLSPLSEAVGFYTSLGFTDSGTRYNLSQWKGSAGAHESTVRYTTNTQESKTQAGYYGSSSSYPEDRVRQPEVNYAHASAYTPEIGSDKLRTGDDGDTLGNARFAVGPNRNDREFIAHMFRGNENKNVLAPIHKKLREIYHDAKGTSKIMDRHGYDREGVERFINGYHQHTVHVRGNEKQWIAIRDPLTADDARIHGVGAVSRTQTRAEDRYSIKPMMFTNDLTAKKALAVAAEKHARARGERGKKKVITVYHGTKPPVDDEYSRFMKDQGYKLINSPDSVSWKKTIED